MSLNLTYNQLTSNLKKAAVCTGRQCSQRFNFWQHFCHLKLKNMELISTSAYPKHKHATNEKNYESFAKIRTCFRWVIGGGGDCCVCVIHKQGLLGLSLYFIVALTAQIFPFPAYKPAFRPGLFAFSAFVSKHNSLAHETKKEKGRFPKAHTKMFFPLRGTPLAKPFPAI